MLTGDNEKVAEKVQKNAQHKYRYSESDAIAGFKNLKKKEVDIYSQNTDDFKKTAAYASVDNKMKNVTVVITDFETSLLPITDGGKDFPPKVLGAEIMGKFKCFIPELNKMELELKTSAKMDDSEYKSAFNPFHSGDSYERVLLQEDFINNFVEAVKARCNSDSMQCEAIIRKNFVNENLVYKE